MKIKLLAILAFNLIVFASLIFPLERMTVAIIVNDQLSEKLFNELKVKLEEDIAAHYNFNFSAAIWPDKKALQQIEKKGDHYLKPEMYTRGYDYVVTVRIADNRALEFVAWSKNFFTNSIYLPINLKIRDDELVEIAVSSLISIIEYTESKLYKNKCF